MGLGCKSYKPLLNTASEQKSISLSWHQCSRTGTYWVKIWDTSYLFEQSPTKFNATVLRGNYSGDCWTEKLSNYQLIIPGNLLLWETLLSLIPWDTRTRTQQALALFASLNPSSGKTTVPPWKTSPWKRTIVAHPRILQQGKMEGKLPTNAHGKQGK